MANFNETTGLVTEVIGDTKTLFELQIKLLQAEVREVAAFSKQAALLGALALAALVPALFFLGLSLSEVLSVSLNLPMWAGHAIVFILLAGVSMVPTLKIVQLVKSRQGEA